MARELAATLQAFELQAELPARLPVGRGTVHPIQGLLRLDAPIVELRLLLDGEPHPAWLSPDPHPWDEAGRHEFWGWAPLPAVSRPRPLELELVAVHSDGSRSSCILGTTELIPSEREPLELPPPAAGPRIVICMATYDPAPELFERQLASIRAQTLENWVCIVCDDRSTPEGLATVRRGCASDPRFVLVESDGVQRGPYDNFQRALDRVPAWAEAVALSDQDDHWYPHKLATLWERLDTTGAQLAYSDVRIVTEGGEVIAETYWTTRRNNYTDLTSLLVANTITGAASLFRAELLDDLLPFPWRINGVMHDWWIGTTALALGEVAYVEEALHDYVQHGANVLGHQAPPIERPSVGELSAFLRRGVPGQPGFDLAVANARSAYFNHTRRVMLTARVLNRRVGSRTTPQKRAILHRVGHMDESRRKLAWMMGRGALRSGRVSDTLGRDFLLGRGIAWRYWAATRSPAARP